MAFEFLEIGSLACGCLATALGELKFIVGPPICENFSPHLKLTDLRLFEWLIWLLWEGRLHAFAVRLCPWSRPATRSSAASAVLRRGSPVEEPPLPARQALPPDYAQDETERRDTSYAALLVRVVIKCGRTAVVVSPSDSGVFEHSCWKRVVELGARLGVVSQSVFTAVAATPCGDACGWSEPLGARPPLQSQRSVANVLVVSSPPADRRTGVRNAHAISA